MFTDNTRSAYAKLISLEDEAALEAGVINAAYDHFVSRFSILSTNINTSLSKLMDTKKLPPNTSDLSVGEFRKKLGLTDYIALGDRIVPKLDYFKGDLHTYVAFFYEQTTPLAEQYKKALDTYVGSMVVVSGTKDVKQQPYTGLLQKVTKDEAVYSSKNAMFFRGNSNDWSKLISLLPNADAAIAYRRTMDENKKPLITDVAFLKGIETGLDKASDALKAQRLSIGHQDGPERLKLLKMLATDGMTVAESARYLVAKAHTSNELRRHATEILSMINERL